MENIILTNNKDLRLVSVKVGVLSTLRFELPLVSASATHVEVIVTSGTVHSAYTATFIPETKRWQCDIAASQFPEVGKQSYEVAYVLDGKQFWDGKGWIEIEDATTSGIEPQPRPEPYRYTVLSVNGYGADAQGAVRIPKTFIATNSPTTTEDYMEGDIYFNRETGAMWTLCNIQGTLTWVFNYQNYYTKAETDEAIDRVAAYYITSDEQGNPFPTRAALLNAETYFSGGVERTPTRNDYAVVLADEEHQGAEWRYIYAVADGQTTGQWEPQYPIETNDYLGLRNKPQINGVTLSGNKSSADLGLASKSDVDPLLFAQYYPDGSVKSAAEFTVGIKYDAPDTTNRTITVKPFCNTGDSANDNSSLVGRVVIPPFVDGDGNPYTSDDGTRYKVVGVSNGGADNINNNLTAIIAPSTVTTIGGSAFIDCDTLTTVSLPAATTIGGSAFIDCDTLTTVSLPAATTIGGSAFVSCDALTTVSLPAATTIGYNAFALCYALTTVSLPAATNIGGIAFAECTSLVSVDFGDTPRPTVPTFGEDAFDGIPTSCKIIVPDAQYDAWTAASGWSDLVTAGYKFLRHSEWEYARKYELDSKLDKSGGTMTGPLTEKHGLVLGKEYGNDFDGFRVDASGNAEMTSHAGGSATIGAVISATQEMPNKANRVANPTAGNLAALDASGNPTDSGVKASDKLDASSASAPFSSDSSVSYPVGSHCTYNGKLYKCTTATTGGTWDASKWTADTMTDHDAVLDITAQNQLRVVAKDGTVLWAQGYDLASTSSATLACDATNNFTFADGATTQAFALPTAPTGKVGDFGLDVDNSANTGAATMTLTGLDTAFSVVVPEGESLNDMLAIEAGELARFYISLSTFRVNNLPTWHIVKQVVENGGATV